MYVLVYWEDRSIETIKEKEMFRRRMEELYSEFEVETINEYVSCAEVEDHLRVAVEHFGGCVYLYEVLEDIGVVFEPLKKFLKKHPELVDEKLKCLILVKSI